MLSTLSVADALAASLHGDVDPVLVGMIVLLLLVVFAFFLMIRRTLLSFTEGLRRGRQ
jgi:flagellar biogenesis protein FliO